MKRAWPWLTALAVLALDRSTKILAPGIPEDGQPLIPGVIGLRYAENKGIGLEPAAFGQDAAFLLLRKKQLRPLPLTGLMMMLGGAAGNMIDRFVHGYVPDMIEFLFVNFAIFNVADACLCIGCALVIIHLLFGKD